MFGFSNKANNDSALAQAAAIGKSQAVIEFKLDGTIVTANENFLNAMGYSLDEIRGKHHSMFVEPAHRHSAEYKAFWEKLGRGEYDSGQYRRIGKGGKEIWILASYNPILDDRGKPFKVVKFATDVTEQKLKAADNDGQIDAIGKSQAVIEFSLDGIILDANPNLLSTMGYSLDEIKGVHHRQFMEPAEAASPDYAAFWRELNAGQFLARKFRRLAKGGREVWLQAVAIGGSARKVSSECQTSVPNGGVVSSFLNLISSGAFLPSFGANGCTVSSPNLRPNAINCSDVMFWSRKMIISFSTSAVSIASNCASSSGWRAWTTSPSPCWIARTRPTASRSPRACSAGLA